MVMSQPLVRNQKAIKDLSLPVLDFFISGGRSLMLSSSSCSEAPFNNNYLIVIRKRINNNKAKAVC